MQLHQIKPADLKLYNTDIIIDNYFVGKIYHIISLGCKHH